MKVGILTGGGDCPGLNAVIRAIVRKGTFQYNDQFVGFLEGWRGVLENKYVALDLQAVADIMPRGGTILRTSRTNPAKREGGLEQCLRNLEQNKLDALVAIGGDDTMGVALKLNERGFKIVGCPKTIDNDLAGTDLCFGFDTAVMIATEAIDRLHTTAESHNRAIVVEVMGRNAGWIAIYSGIAGSADVILIPEKPFDIDEVVASLKRQHSQGRRYSILVVAEGAKFAETGHGPVVQAAGRDEFGHERLGGIGQVLAQEVEKRTGFETRAVVLGHTQRGGTPTAFDRVLGTRYGAGAIDLVHKGDFGKMVALHGTEIVSVPLAAALSVNRTVDQKLIAMAESLLAPSPQTVGKSQ